MHVRCSTRTDGDFHRIDVPFAALERRRRAFVDLPWTMLAEHHGVDALEIARPGEHDGAPGDVMSTGLVGAVLGCWVGDCAPVVVIGKSGRFSVAHAGWRGLAGGVLDVAVDAVGERIDRVVIGPTIGPCCYEFGREDLDMVAAGMRLSSDLVGAVTSDGAPALDVPAAVGAVARRLGVPLVRLGGCTGCSYPGYSYRVRRDPQRHVVAVWQETA